MISFFVYIIGENNSLSMVCRKGSNFDLFDQLLMLFSKMVGFIELWNWLIFFFLFVRMFQYLL